MHETERDPITGRPFFVAPTDRRVYGHQLAPLFRQAHAQQTALTTPFKAPLKIVGLDFTAEGDTQLPRMAMSYSQDRHLVIGMVTRPFGPHQQALHDWIKTNLPELHRQLYSAEMSQAYRILREYTGQDVDKCGQVEVGSRQFLEALQRMHPDITPD